MLYVKSKTARPQILKKLKPIAEKIKEMGQLEDDIRARQKNLNDLKDRSRELRENLKLLEKSKNKKLKADQWKRLMDIDQRVAKITDDIVRLREQVSELKVVLRNLADKLEIVF